MRVDNIPLPQLLDGQLLAQFLAVCVVVHAIRCASRAGKSPSDTCRCGCATSASARFSMLSGTVMPASSGVLQLQLRHDQALENLRDQHFLRGQFRIFCAQSLHDEHRLFIEFA